MRILIIEDDREAADYLLKALKEAGHAPDLAVDGEDGLELAISNTWDVLVVDRMLPKRDGLSIIETLRASNDETPSSSFQPCLRWMIASLVCALVEMTTSPNPTHFRSFLPV